MRRIRVYLKNALILTVTGLVLRAAGMIFRVYIAGQIGEEGMGLYQLIFTIYSLCITFATSGISVVATRLTAEELTQSDMSRARGVFRKVLWLGGCLGSIAGISQFLLAYPVSKYCLGDARAALSLRLLAPSLPFMAVASAIKGYFFARRKVGPNSRTQIYEQIIRITLVLVILPYTIDWGVEYACAVIYIGNTVSEIVSALVIGYAYKKDTKILFKQIAESVPKDVSMRIWKILVPVQGGRCLDSALHTVENTLVPACLLTFLGSREKSLAEFGALKGMAMPILLFPFSFLNPLATLLLPEVTEAHILKRQNSLEMLVGRIMLFTTTFSVLAGGLITLYAYPLGRILYHNETIGFYLAILAPVLPGMYLDAMGDSVLKGLGEEKATFRYSIIDSMLRIGMVISLVPKIGMKGFLFVTICSNILSALLNIFRIEKVAGIKTQWYQWFLQPIVLFIISAILGEGGLKLMNITGDWTRLLIGSALISGIYTVFMMHCGLGDAIRTIIGKRNDAVKAKTFS